MAESPSTFARWLPFLAVGAPIVGALASLYLMTNTAYTKAVALEQRIAVNEASIQRQELQAKALCSSLVEIETQFRASDQARSLIHADDMRLHAMLWQKAFAGSTYPTDNAYYPTIAQDHPQPCG